MDLYFEGYLDGPPTRSLEEIMRCAGWRPVKAEGGWTVFEVDSDIPLLRRAYLKVRERGPWSFEGEGYALGSRLEFSLDLSRSGERVRWVFRGRQSGLVDLLGRGFVEAVARSLADRLAKCCRG
ncbi:hypothetical protein TUZN_1092 [Thermoproteus uzoniensis 768-20]|uniref:Polyketide cyclase / dehydrase and lipid transport n=1 Tax=Thermoproteus uzoniensis (strain 768-20) TaxID=999630 RepID=F2L090_THEU7|nr:SRPBCC domain-containing protein [Thermoproteus uzoniensis]AEA12572.1 hypothetical protein TUZN_1092 [Thermoproteus uzoniensis 768-20]